MKFYTTTFFLMVLLFSAISQETNQTNSIKNELQQLIEENEVKVVEVSILDDKSVLVSSEEFEITDNYIIFKSKIRTRYIVLKKIKRFDLFKMSGKMVVRFYI